jgi:hypothetical protein
MNAKGTSAFQLFSFSAFQVLGFKFQHFSISAAAGLANNLCA